MLLLYMDHHVPAPISASLRQRGIDVLTAEEDGTATLDDDSLLDRATLLGRVLFSRDMDLLAIAHQRQETGREFAGVAYAHQLRASIGQAVRDLELLAKIFRSGRHAQSRRVPALFLSEQILPGRGVDELLS